MEGELPPAMPLTDESSAGSARTVSTEELLALREGAFRRSRVQFVDMICSGVARHPRRMKKLLQSGHADDGSFGSAYYMVGVDRWSPFAICPSCPSFLDEARFFDESDRAQVREADRPVFFLKEDGKETRLAVPLQKEGPGWEASRARRLALGYRMVEARTVRDMDRFDQIRARQTGNTVYNELNYDSATRLLRNEETRYDDVDMTRDY